MRSSFSEEGNLTARFEAEYDQRITQRLILQPRAEIDFALQDVPEVGVGSGLSKAEVGLRLRHEIAREFAHTWASSTTGRSETRRTSHAPEARRSTI